MTSFEEYNSGELTAAEPDQDRIINQLIFDSDFIEKCLRYQITPGLFVSGIRVRVVEFIFEYYKQYQESPKENITDILGQNKLKIKIKDDDLETAIDFISRVIQINNTSGNVKRLYDILLEFRKKQSIAQAVSRISKMKDQIDGTPEKLERIMSDAVDDLKKTDRMEKPESIFDSDGYESGTILTKFGIPEIDDALGGGLFAPNLMIIQAFTGRGKTWSMTHLIKMATRLGNNCCAFITEMANRKFKNRMRMSLTGWTGKEIYNKMNEADSNIKISMVGKSVLDIAPESWKMGENVYVDSIKPFVEECEDRNQKECKLIFIDSPDDLEPPENTFCKTEIERSKAIYTWLRNYAQNHDKAIIVTAQSQRASEKLLWTTSGNIGDDINKVRRCTVGVSINGFKKEVEANFTRLLVFKNTHGPEMKAAWILSDFGRGQWIQEYGIIKNLDVKEYRDKLSQRGIKLTSEIGIG